MAVKADKLNYLWVMDRASPGGFNLGGCVEYTTCPTSFVPDCDPTKWDNQNAQTLQASTNSNESRSAPAFWSGNSSGNVKGWLFFAATYDVIKAYPVANPCTAPYTGNGPVLCDPAFQTPHGLGYTSTPSVSSNGNSNGIVWAIKLDVSSDSGLYAFDATNLNQLWNSGQCVDTIGNPRDKPGFSTKFSVPTIANGYVYIGTEKDFDIYGQVPTRTCTASQ